MFDSSFVLTYLERSRSKLNVVSAPTHNSSHETPRLR